MFRLSRQGRLVGGFGSGGHALIGFRNASGAFESWFPSGPLLGPGGTITITGDGSSAAAGKIFTIRLTRRGQLDPSFGDGGRSVVRGPGNADFVRASALVDAARRTAIGVGATLVQLGASGRPDLRFAPQGRLRIVEPRGVELQALARDGRRGMVLAGASGDGAYLALYHVPAD